MAVTTTTRLGITRWTAGADAFTRLQLDTSHAQMEDKSAGFLQGTSRPSAASSNLGFFYFNTTTDVLSYSDGTQWVDVTGGDGNFGSPEDLAIGDTATDGSNATAARSDHGHGMPSFGSPSAVSTALSDGVATTPARSDHGHNIGTGAINNATMLSTNVVAETAIQSGAVTATKIGTNAVGQTAIGPLSVGTSELIDDTVTNDKMALLAVDTGEIVDLAVTNAKINDVDASKVNAGVLNVARIPDLDAAKITTGTFTTSHIPNLDTSKITTGTFTAPRIPSLDASKINSGTFGTQRIPDLSAAKITSGTMAMDRLPNETWVNWQGSWGSTGGLYVSTADPVDSVDGTNRSIWFVY